MNRLFVDNITVIDCALLDHQRGLIGESWIVDLELAGMLDSQSMVLDFGDIKRDIKKHIDEKVDHCLLVPTLSPAVELHTTATATHLTFQDVQGNRYQHTSPEQALCRLAVTEVTVEAVIASLQTSLAEILPSNVIKITLHLKNEIDDGPTFRYVHGLKKHAGNCQRIAHGHRSKIRIFENNRMHPTLSQQWATRWHDIYLGSESDLVSSNDSHYTFAYQAEQGHFEFSIPKSRCEIIGTDSTIEELAAFVATEVANDNPSSSWTAKVYEGVNKGALYHIAGPTQ